MTEIIRAASAGTLESSDVYVEIEPQAQGIELDECPLSNTELTEALLQVYKNSVSHTIPCQTDFYTIN